LRRTGRIQIKERESRLSPGIWEITLHPPGILMDPTKTKGI
jgi:hypothetical protein